MPYFLSVFLYDCVGCVGTMWSLLCVTDHVRELSLLLHPHGHHPGGPQHVGDSLHVTHPGVTQVCQDQ